MMRACLLVSVALCVHSLWAQADPALPEPQSSSPTHYVSIHAGPAVSASGSIVASSWAGLRLLELLVNSNVLYAPRISPALRYTGPIYKVPPLELSSRQYGFLYERRMDHWFFGGALSYTDIKARLQIPETFVVAPNLGLNVPLVFRVTPEIHGRMLLASALQAEGSAAYHFWPEEVLDPYVRVFAGVGKGFVAHPLGGPYLHEIHAGTAVGLRWNRESLFFGSEVNVIGHWVNSGPSSFIDRTNVLVNPGNGSIYIVRLLLSAGMRF